ncbi:MAG: polysaccharide lyase [Cyanobacteria bacterium P01_C01_bin.120]
MMRWVSSLSLGLLLLSNCSATSVTLSPSASSVSSEASANEVVLWQGDFLAADWMQGWGAQDSGAWGLENLTVRTVETGPFPAILRVYYPAGSASPSVSRRQGVPLGGGQFYADLDLPPQTALRLSYAVRFAANFDFVKGGKLPGLYGGVGNSGGDIPDGTDGFSTRLMWRRDGEGELYAYLPTSERYGTSIERGAWTFQPGVWHRIEQEIVLNDPDQQNGQARIWVDGQQVISQNSLQFRTTDDLKIDGLFFSTFFGGGDASWSTPHDVHIDFADFSVSEVAPTTTTP